jgi:hypothetical protein
LIRSYLANMTAYEVPEWWKRLPECVHQLAEMFICPIDTCFHESRLPTYWLGLLTVNT